MRKQRPEQIKRRKIRTRLSLNQSPIWWAVFYKSRVILENTSLGKKCHVVIWQIRTFEKFLFFKRSPDWNTSAAHKIIEKWQIVWPCNFWSCLFVFVWHKTYQKPRPRTGKARRSEILTVRDIVVRLQSAREEPRQKGRQVGRKKGHKGGHQEVILCVMVTIHCIYKWSKFRTVHESLLLFVCKLTERYSLSSVIIDLLRRLEALKNILIAHLILINS